ncbi:MAG: hypothetical protein O3B13_25710 [Planctomycetota bacterium]|nr:hypothetical protein [Planctomycetota bacterium]
MEPIEIVERFEPVNMVPCLPLAAIMLHSDGTTEVIPLTGFGTILRRDVLEDRRPDAETPERELGTGLLLGGCVLEPDTGRFVWPEQLEDDEIAFVGYAELGSNHSEVLVDAIAHVRNVRGWLGSTDPAMN